MPNTITEFNVFTPGTKARSSQVNTNFTNYRGTILPINSDTASASHITHDLGSGEHRWKTAFCQTIDIQGSTTTASLQITSDAATATGFKLEISSLTVGRIDELGFNGSSIAPGTIPNTALITKGMLQQIEFTANGTFTIPSGVSFIIVRMAGGGGGGGSGACGGSGNNASGGGGGNGSMPIIFGISVTAGVALSITVGSGGAGGASKAVQGNGNAGSSGSSSSVGVISVQGGAGGGPGLQTITAGGGAGGTNAWGPVSLVIGGGVGGVASTGTGDADGSASLYASGGTKGGGSVGSAGGGGGGGGLGAGGNGSVGASATTNPGTNGIKGGGGGGSGGSFANPSGKGGDGGAGNVLIIYGC
jgi:hypothetical protein